MTALAVRAGLIGTPLPNGLTLPDDLTFEEWRGALYHAELIVEAGPWFLVDLMAYGEARFGERASQAFPTAEDDPSGYRQSRLKQAAWMASKFPRYARNPNLSYSHHRAVAELPPADRQQLLAEAERERLSTRALVRRVEEHRLREGGAVDATGVPVETPDLPWLPTLEDLAPDARAALEARAPGGRLRSAYLEGALYALYWYGARWAFTTWQGD